MQKMVKKNTAKNLLVPDVFPFTSDGQAWKANGVIQIILYEKEKK